MIDEANEAGGRDNITVVLFRLEEVGATARRRRADDGRLTGAAELRRVRGAASGAPPSRRRRLGCRCRARSRADARGTAPSRRPSSSEARAALRRSPHARQASSSAAAQERRYIKPLAALLAVVIVLGLIIGGGYLASRQLYFIGTNSQGIVTIYRGFPYDLPAGIRLYETFYVSGVPAVAGPGRPAQRAVQPPPALADGRREPGARSSSSGPG